jgi:uncharacterized protein (DUF885 family)
MSSWAHTDSRAAADAYLDRRAAVDPDAADALGRDVGSLVPDLSPAGFAARHQTDVAGLAALGSDPPDALGAAMVERLSADIALYDCGFTTSLLAPLATPVHRLRQIFDDLPRDTEDDWDRVGRELYAVVDGYRDYAATLTDSARRGHRIAARQVRIVADQCESWIDPDGTDFYRALAREYPGDGPPAARLAGAAELATGAAAGFVTFLRRDLLPHATDSDPVGRDIYQITSQAFLGARVDLTELYDYGWAELRRLTDLATALAHQLTGEDDLPSARDILDRRDGATVSVGEQLVTWLQRRLDRTAEVLDGSHFDIPPATRAVQARMVTAGSGVMYYSPPDPGLTRPGRVWWSVPPGTATVPTWREVSTVHHEGLPGHHLQHAITFGVTGLHPWQRYLCHVHGYAEGWAHYAEGLAVELGLVRDGAELLGVYGAQLWRAARIVIDLGLHLQLPIPAGTGLTDRRSWTPEFGAAFLARMAGTDPATARYEVDRYLGWPGQALAFKVGARLWSAAREDRRRQLADRFDLKDFHMAALRLGPMGLDPLRAALATTEAAR